MKPQLLSGARGTIRVAGKVWAMATDISIDSPVKVNAIHTFGAMNARSVEPLQAGPCTVSIGRMIPVNKADGTPIDTSAIALGAEPTILEMITADDIQIELIDKVTGKTYACVKNCRFAGRSMSLSASSIAQERVSFMGIYDAGRDGQNTLSKGPGFEG